MKRIYALSVFVFLGVVIFFMTDKLIGFKPWDGDIGNMRGRYLLSGVIAFGLITGAIPFIRSIWRKPGKMNLRLVLLTVPVLTGLVCLVTLRGWFLFAPYSFEIYYVLRSILGMNYLSINYAIGVFGGLIIMMVLKLVTGEEGLIKIDGKY